MFSRSIHVTLRLFLFPAPKRVTNSATSSARRANEERRLDQNIESFITADAVSNLQELHEKLRKEILPSGFKLVMMRIGDQDILNIRIEDIEEVTGAPIITHNLSIFSDSSFKIQINGTINSSSIVKDITASSEHFSTLAEVLK